MGGCGLHNGVYGDTFEEMSLLELDSSLYLIEWVPNSAWCTGPRDPYENAGQQLVRNGPAFPWSGSELVFSLSNFTH